MRHATIIGGIAGSRLSRAKSRVATLVLLGLVVHALLISVVHHHGPGPREELMSATLLPAGGGSSEDAPDSAGDSHCLSCRLQRTSAYEVRSPSLTIDLIAGPVKHFALYSCLHSSGSPLILSNRAPPAA
jgi:hypothetical protein